MPVISTRVYLSREQRKHFLAVMSRLALDCVALKKITRNSLRKIDKDPYSFRSEFFKLIEKMNLSEESE